MRRILLTLIFIATPLAWAEMTGGLDWAAIRSLEGRRTLHDGPNCYNSTMIAKGYDSIVSQTSDEELKFYLAKYCRKVPRASVPGEILVKFVDVEHQTEHSAVYVGEGKIFEKSGIAGLQGHFSKLEPGIFTGDLNFDSVYAIRKIDESEYFKTGEETLVYRCLPAGDVNQQTKIFKQSAEFQVITEAKQVFAKLAFDQNPGALESYENIGAKIQAVTAMINNLRGVDEKDLFLYAHATSVWINFANTREEYRIDYEKPLPLKPEFERMTSAMDLLAQRLRDSRKDPQTHYIVGDARPLSH